MIQFNPEAKGYLEEACIIAEIINRSSLDVKAYWFFTPYTLPHEKLKQLLKSSKHEIGLHVINSPSEELMILEDWVGQKINYYTIHGTTSRLSQMAWGRETGQKQAIIPPDFPLKSLHTEPTFSFDKACYNAGVIQATKIGEQEIAVNHILSMHPEWLRWGNGKDRGSYYYPLSYILLSGKTLNTLNREAKCADKTKNQSQ